DVAATEQVLGAWAQGSRPLGTVAIDGKRLRGSAPAGHDGSEGVHVVAAFASQLGAVIGQVQVAPEADEITAALALLKSLPLAGAILPRDGAVLPAGGLPGRARPQGGLPVHREGEPTATYGRHRPRIRRRLSPRS